jgi:uncharacterized protein (DUF433 family)
MSTTITENGRINGTRITVHDVYYYLKNHRPHTEIALILGLFPDDVLTAIHYIEEHREECEAVYQRVEERIARGNPPEMMAKLEQTRAKMAAWKAERQSSREQELDGEGNSHGRQH